MKEREARDELQKREQQELAEATAKSEARRQRALERRALARKELEAEQIEPPARPAWREEVETEKGHGELLALKTEGKFIVDSNSDSMDLRGITVVGLDTLALAGGQTFRSALSLDDRNISVITELWDANLVRLPFQPESMLSGNSALPADDLLAGLDETIHALTTAGVYALLALEVPTAGGQTSLLQFIAERYREEPGVLYEIFTAAPSPEWLRIAEVLVGVIRHQNPASLIFLGSGKGGVDVAGLPLRFSAGDPVFNLVYTINISAGSSIHQDERQLHVLAQSYPLFASSWTDDGADLGRSSEHAARSFERYGIGWAASNWNAEPRLVSDAANHDFRPTPWGRIVQRALRLAVKPLLKPFAPLAFHN